MLRLPIRPGTVQWAHSTASAPSSFWAKGICARRSYQTIDCRRGPAALSFRTGHRCVSRLESIYKHQPPLAHPLLSRTCFTHATMASGPAQDVTASQRDAYRLPTDLKPTHYDVVVRTDLKELKFDGYVVAQYVLYVASYQSYVLTLSSLDVVEDTSSIVFNTAKLGLGAARVSSTSLKQEFVQTSSAFAFDEDNERATIKLPGTLTAGSKVTVKIDFDGELTGSMMGYYRSAYEVDGKTEHYTLTQFEVRL